MENDGEIGVEERIRRMEWAIEKEEREKRKRNLIFKGVKGGERDAVEEIRKICDELEVEVEIEETRRVKTGREGRGEVIIVTVKKEENKRRILERKRRLRGMDSEVGNRGRKKGERRARGKWNEEGREEFIKLMEKRPERRDESIKEKWEELKERIGAALKKVDEKKDREGGG